ncbi:MAG: acetate kinase [Erysipelotrichaceae bacterium]
MTKIISVNAGSSSLKFQLFEMPEEKVLTNGMVDRIGFKDGIFTIKVNGKKFEQILPIEDHSVAVQLLLKALIEHGVVANLNEIKGAGHRVVHGGEYFSGSAIVDAQVEGHVEELSELAPLHNPAALVGYRAFKKELPSCKHIMAFDTAFHQTLGPESYMYPLPMEYYTEYKIRKYGFHGTSHQYVCNRYAEIVGKDIKDLNIISCHLGNGASVTAVKGGVSINTSMGFTPLGGIMMGTRCGDIDPAIIPYLMKKTGMTPSDVDYALNKKSGMLGISGVSSDGRDIEDGCSANDPKCLLTHEIYINRLTNTIGGYIVQMGSVDAILFTGGIGENDCNLRGKVCCKMEEALGVHIDYKLNSDARGYELRLSTPESKIDVWMLPTNEELVISRDAYRLLRFDNE